MRNDRMIVIWESCRKKYSWCIVRYWPHIFLEELMKP